MKFKKAVKHQAKLRLAVFGPSGAGKTMSSLRIAHGMASRVAVIDSERGSASKYADRWEFDVLDLDNKTIQQGYVPAIQAAAQEGYPVLIIDSLSHAWQELLEEVDSIAKAKYRGNTWSAWSEGTPKQRKLVQAIIEYPGHVIVTMRSDTEWIQEKDERTGKVKPVKVGLKPQQGKGIEYEFDMLMEMTVEHYATVTKDRTGKFQDRLIEKPDEDFGRELVEWLNTGSPEKTPQAVKGMLESNGHNVTTGDKIPSKGNHAMSKIREFCDRLEQCADLGTLKAIRDEVMQQPKAISTATEIRRAGAAAKVRCLLCSPQNSEGYAKELAEAVKHADDKTVENFAMWWSSEGTRGLFTEPALSILNDAAMASVG